jgi:flagellar hook-basal body complex protein FliE
MKEIELQLPSFVDAERPPGRLEGGAGAGSAQGASFARDLGQAIDAVDHLQLDADKQADQVAQGAGNLHEVALALEKADVAMRLATKVRNKVIDTYNEIMRMSI